MKELVNESLAVELVVAAPPEKVFAALAREIGHWWTHKYKAEGKVFLEPHVGGRFGESWGESGGALYAVVDYIDPPRRIRMSGPMGMEGATACSVQFDLEGAEGGTRLSLVHDILGRLEAGTAESYRAGWKELLGVALAEYVEKGKIA